MGLEPLRANELLRRQDTLQAEAGRVLDALDLMRLLSAAGDTVQVGSSVLGLMTWRDIDINVYCRQLSADLAFETMRPLASRPGVAKLRFANWRGPLATSDLPDGYWWGVRYRRERDAEWKIDVWFLDDSTPHSHTNRTGAIKDHLTPETRLAILWIKDTWCHHPAYRDTVLSVDIYDAVLEHGIRTPDAFETYLIEREKFPR